MSPEALDQKQSWNPNPGTAMLDAGVSSSMALHLTLLTASPQGVHAHMASPQEPTPPPHLEERASGPWQTRVG